MRRTNRATGYTLIELLLYVVLTATLLTSMAYFLGMVVDARVKHQTITEVEQQGQMAIDAIAQVIRNSNAVSTPGPGTTGSSLQLLVPAAGESPMVFDMVAGSLRVSKGTAAPVALTNRQVTVRSFSVTNVTPVLAPGVVQVSLTLQRTNPSGRNEYTWQKTFTTSVAVRTGP